MTGAEWESVIGGSWLNKLGVLVLVIGLALFLGYSLTHLGPAGKIAIGFTVNAALLVGGIVLERRARYVVFARGLVGGGWAALYFTTYAMHGLGATRVIHHPLPAAISLGLVATGIILHSLRYRSQTVTGMAYVVGFVTVTISPVSTFSLIASVPLAGSLLVVAQRLSWTAMAVGGVVATYGTYAVRHATAHLRAWTPLALLMVAVFYANRALIRSGARSPLILPERAYSYLASALVALVLRFEVMYPYRGLAWLVAALPLYEVGLRGRLPELRLQSHGLAGLGLMALLATKALGVGNDAARSPWLTLAPAVLLTYASATRLLRSRPRT